MGGPRRRLLLISACAFGLLASSAPAKGGRHFLDVKTFARVPAPGLPEGIAVSGKGKKLRVFVGTSPKDALGLDGKPPSKVFAYDRKGSLRRAFTVTGQDRINPGYGLYGMAFDAGRRLYALDFAPPRVIRLDPRTGNQSTYATFPDVPPCGPLVTGPCSQTLLDRPPFPDYPVFARDGTMYVTDAAQALIWRVAPGGGTPSVWYTDRGLESVFGPNGVGFMPDGRTLLYAQTNQGPPLVTDRPPGLYRIAVQPNGAPGSPSLFWRSQDDDAPDGFAIGRSGRVYLALSSPTQPQVVVVSPHGDEIARVPGSEQENQTQQIPFDAPASAAFVGRTVLVTNHAFVTRNREHYAVLDVYAGERGLPLFRPVLP
jgi:sugar lactone lactonase YvrE